MNLFDFEEMIIPSADVNSAVALSDDEINAKYEKGEIRIVTEQGAIKLSLVNSVFDAENYQLQPEFQRRITWDETKRSKLIESFIMNVPVPPIFVYETDYDSYQVMDGLQRVSAIMDFYNNKYALTELKQWGELNGKFYKDLPKKVKDGIDRRQLSVITLLKESSKSQEQEDEMKKMVFERLNTGGVKLSDQEIRNALYNGPFNSLCIKLAENSSFRRLWDIRPDQNLVKNEEDVEDIDDAILYAKDAKYMRMQDVELVLRFFAMRHLNSFSGNLRDFLDNCLRKYNNYDDEELLQLKELFEKVISFAETLFGDKAFCQFNCTKNKWSSAVKMIYDPIVRALCSIDFKQYMEKDYSVENNVSKLIEFYKEHEDLFDGKRQGKNDIENRTELFVMFIKSIVED